MNDLDRSIAKREARSPGYRARLARELREVSSVAGKPAAAKSHREAEPGANLPEVRGRRKGKPAPNSGAAKRSPRQSSPVLTELSAKLSSTAEAMRAALDRRSGQ